MRSARYDRYSYAFGPGPITPAVKAIIWANIAVFLITFFVPAVVPYLGLKPERVFHAFWMWQPVTYMFLHRDMLHILFNMLGIWMFGVELERLWGTRGFVKYYAITGVGAAAATLLVSLLPIEFGRITYGAITMGASGAFYGLLLAYALYYPERPILLLFLFAVPAKYCVIIYGALSLLASMDNPGGVAHAAHLGGLVAGYLYLKSGRGGLVAEIKYRYLKWKMNRLRKRFDVYSGGRNDWNRKIH